MNAMQRGTLGIGRLFLCLIFLMSGVHKITAWDSTLQRMESEGMIAVNMLLVGAILCEVGGGLLVLLGMWTRLGALALIVFLIPTTLIFHDFWQFSGQEQQTQMIHFMKNVAILGGLFVLLGAGPGCCSVDGRRKREFAQ